MADGVNISLEEMYRLLLSIDAKVTALSTDSHNSVRVLGDHEQRLRELEAAQNAATMEQMESNVVRIMDDVESLKKRVYAVPAASAVIAGAALVITLVRWL